MAETFSFRLVDYARQERLLADHRIDGVMVTLHTGLQKASRLEIDVCGIVDVDKATVKLIRETIDRHFLSGGKLDKITVVYDPNHLTGTTYLLEGELIGGQQLNQNMDPIFRQVLYQFEIRDGQPTSH